MLMPIRSPYVAVSAPTGPSGAATLSYLTGGAATAAVSTSLSIGTAATYRYVIVQIATMQNGALPPSVTVGGVSASSVCSGTYQKIWAANVPSGTTATLSIPFTSGQIFAWTAYLANNLSSITPIATSIGTTNTAPYNSVLASDTNGLIVGNIMSAYVSKYTMSVSGATSNYSANYNGNTQTNHFSLCPVTSTSSTIGTSALTFMVVPVTHYYCIASLR